MQILAYELYIFGCGRLCQTSLVNGDTFGSAEGSDPVETMHILCMYDGAGHFSQD